jgi:hypothetical protein
MRSRTVRMEKYRVPPESPPLPTWKVFLKHRVKDLGFPLSWARVMP